MEAWDETKRDVCRIAKRLAKRITGCNLRNKKLPSKVSHFLQALGRWHSAPEEKHWGIAPHRRHGWEGVRGGVRQGQREGWVRLRQHPPMVAAMCFVSRLPAHEALGGCLGASRRPSLCIGAGRLPCPHGSGTQPTVRSSWRGRSRRCSRYPRRRSYHRLSDGLEMLLTVLC